MLLDALVRQVTGYWDDPAPWQIVESDDMLHFRWRSLEAEWQHPDEEDLEAWVCDEAFTLQELCAAHLQETWEDTLYTMIAEHLLTAGVPADVVEQITILFDIEDEWPSHGEMAAWENRPPEGRVFVEVVSDAFDMEPVDTFWLGQEEIATMAETLAAAWVERWREG